MQTMGLYSSTVTLIRLSGEDVQQRSPPEHSVHEINQLMGGAGQIGSWVGVNFGMA